MFIDAMRSAGIGIPTELFLLLLFSVSCITPNDWTGNDIDVTLLDLKVKYTANIILSYESYRLIESLHSR